MQLKLSLVGVKLGVWSNGVGRHSGCRRQLMFRDAGQAVPELLVTKCTYRNTGVPDMAHPAVPPLAVDLHLQRRELPNPL